MTMPTDDYFGRFIEVSTKTPRVLLVDANRDVVETVLTFAQNFHVQMDSAGDSLAAIGFFEHYEYLAVLLDLDLPGISGIEVFKRIRQISRDIPIGIISGAVRQGIIEELLAYGRFTHLPKPFQTGLRDLKGWLLALGVKEQIHEVCH